MPDTPPLPEPVRSPFTTRRVGLVGLFIVCCMAFFWRLGSAPLFDLDEALYVTCARQMVETGDWITPRLNSRPLDRPEQPRVAFFEKPILVYWTAAASLKIFGTSEMAARLPVAFAALCTTFTVALFGMRHFGTRAGLLAGMVYATAPLTVLDARQQTTDGLLVCWLTLAFLSFWEAGGRMLAPSALEEEPLRSGWRPLLLVLTFWTMLALAVLTKGAIGLALPGLIIGLTLLLDFKPLRLRRVPAWWPVVRKMRPGLGMCVLLLIALPWHLRIAQSGERDAQGRTFVQEYLLRQHIGRFRGGDKVHNAPLPTYLVFFLVGFFPWACFMPMAFRWQPYPVRKQIRADFSASATPFQPSPAIIRAIDSLEAPSILARPPAENTLPLHRFLLLWFGTIFVFFSISAAKLPTYIAPLYPAAALLVGRWLSNLWEAGSPRALRGGALAAVMTAILLAGAGFVGPRFAPASAPIPEDVVSLVRALTLLLLFGCLTALICFWREWRPAGVTTLAVTMLAVFGMGVTEGYAVAARDVLDPYQQMAIRANNMGSDVTPVIYYHIVPRRPSMLYYARYSPLERKEKPLLPFLRPHLAHTSSALLITSRRAFETELRAEVRRAPDIALRELSHTGDAMQGWVLARITRTPPNSISGKERE